MFLKESSELQLLLFHEDVRHLSGCLTSSWQIVQSWDQPSRLAPAYNYWQTHHFYIYLNKILQSILFANIGIKWTRSKHKKLSSFYWDIPSQIDWNWLFHHPFNYLAFGGLYSAEEIKNLCFFIGKKYLFKDLWVGNFDTHIGSMKRSVF